MNNKYDFNKLKNKIKDLPVNEQQRELIEARTDYLQNVSPISRNVLEVSFDEKCKLEIEKIKEIMKIGLA